MGTSFKPMTAISKNVYFDVFNDIVNKYNSTVHRTIKMKPVDIASDFYAEYHDILMKKIPNLKLVIALGFQNTKMFLLKDTCKIGQRKFLSLAELKIQVPWTYVISDANGEKITEIFLWKRIAKN